MNEGVDVGVGRGGWRGTEGYVGGETGRGWKGRVAGEDTSLSRTAGDSSRPSRSVPPMRPVGWGRRQAKAAGGASRRTWHGMVQDKASSSRERERKVEDR